MESSEEYDNNEIIPSDDATYWMYIMDKKKWDEYTRVTNSSEDNNLYISSYDNSGVEKGDIIFYYIKGGKDSGFIGFSRAGDDQKYNDAKIKVFKDTNLNKNIVKIDYLMIFTDSIKMSRVLPFIKEETAGHRNESSFRPRYLKDTNSFKKLAYGGNMLLQKLYEFSDDNKKINTKHGRKHDRKKENRLDNYESDDMEEFDDGYKPKRRKLKINSNVNFISSENSSSDSSEVLYSDECIKKKTKQLNDEDSSSEYESYRSDDNTSDESNGDSTESEDVDGEIPILIIPCKKFKWPRGLAKQINYCISHLKKCRKCDVTDNNDKSYGTIIDKAKVDLVVSNSEYDEYYDTALECYDNLKRYAPNDVNNGPFIRIIRIECGDMYNGCILLTWNT